MRKMMKTILVVTFAVAGSAAVYAQAPDQSPRPHGQFDRRGGNPEFETKMLTRRLKLTPDQVAQVEPILAASREQLKALRPADGTKPDFKAMQEQRKAIMSETEAKLDAVLTPEQQQELAKMHEHQFHGGPRGDRGNWKPQGSPAPSA